MENDGENIPEIIRKAFEERRGRRGDILQDAFVKEELFERQKIYVLEKDKEDGEDECDDEAPLKMILFVIQNTGFSTRLLLAPAELFKKVRETEYNILKEHAEKNVAMDGVTIENLLIQNMIREGNALREEHYPWSDAAHIADFYSDPPIEDDECLLETKDGEWAKDREWVKSSFRDCASFDPLDDYKKLCNFKGLCDLGFYENRQTRKIEVVESFLILETTNGERPNILFKNATEMILSDLSDRLTEDQNSEPHS
jgi:hypothetical protein